MEENVALDTAKQKKFEKSIKGIKKLIKKNRTDPKAEVKDSKSEKRKRKERGLVYLSHIPHGFYEHEMTQYFKQFGVVTNARVIRSKHTGRSRGFAFVEFKEPSVAQIVAETMNNYLMGKRLIKASYMPPEKQRQRALRKFWSDTHNPGAEWRLKMKKAYNADKDEEEELLRAKKMLANLTKTKKKLSEMGINYDFFVPVDVPEKLTAKVEQEIIRTVKKEKENIVKEKKENIPTPKKKNKKETKSTTEMEVVVKNKKNEKNIQKNGETKVKTKKTVDIELENDSKNKQKSLKAKGMKLMEDYIQVQEDSEDSDGSFDSDEFEKMLADDDGTASASENGSLSEDEDDESQSDDDESIEEVLHPKKNKGATTMQKIPQKQQQKNIGKQTKPPQNKRKAAEKNTVLQKKPKFEKQVKNSISNTKQFKKKK